MPMMPKRVKYRKSQKGRVRGNATRGNYVAFGEYGLQSLEPGKISAATIEAGRDRRQPVGQGGRQALHPDLPPQERDLDPGRDPDGQGQGRGRVLGGRRQAGHRPLRARPASARSSPAPPSPGSSHKLPVRCRFVDPAADALTRAEPSRAETDRRQTDRGRRP